LGRESLCLRATIGGGRQTAGLLVVIDKTFQVKVIDAGGGESGRFFLPYLYFFMYFLVLSQTERFIGGWTERFQGELVGTRMSAVALLHELQKTPVAQLPA